MSEEKGTSSVTPSLRRELAKWAFWGAIIAAFVGAVGSVVAALITIVPRLPPQEYIYSAQVSASTYPFANTNVTLEKGDDVQIIVQGVDAYWNCGKGDTSAEGIFGDRWSGHIVASANACELVGYIRQGVFFRVGAYERFQATDSGPLYLGANDSPASPTYYQDNSGILAVQIVVKRGAAK
jgi:hypothetical protein